MTRDEEIQILNAEYARLRNEYVQLVYNFIRNAAEHSLQEIAEYIVTHIDEYELDCITGGVFDPRNLYDQRAILEKAKGEGR